METNSENPIINCHVHIFTGEHVPPFLAKKFVPWPFYYLLHVHSFLSFWKFINKQRSYRYNPVHWFNRLKRGFNKFLAFVDRNGAIKFIWMLLLAWLTINAIVILLYWLSTSIEAARAIYEVIKDKLEFLFNGNILFTPESLPILSIIVFIIVFLLIKSGRNFIFFILKSFVKFFKFLPGKNTLDLLDRYLLLGRFTLYKGQGGIYQRLRAQYEPGTRFVILPMDMEFMDAGLPPCDFYEQMNELYAVKAKHKESCLPFVFVDPRRIEKDGSRFFAYTADEGKVTLQKGCFIQDFIEKKNFAGFKIYPALGYYPFDEKLLPLWKYAADKQIPIMTHCIKGTIFYRGTKQKDWDVHPVFKEEREEGEFVPLPLSAHKNIDFSLNFTHPLNYLCLLEEPFLRVLVQQAKDDGIRDLFGYTGTDHKLKYDLRELKICLAHFGGEDQWAKYLEKDRYAFSQQLIRYRGRGLDFAPDKNGDIVWGRFERHWKYVDWYSIIYSLMAQYDNMYADISYILSTPEIFPLLKETLSDLNPKVRTRALFGTDFYVVRNHHSDKELLANSAGLLNKTEFDLIARQNPLSYLRKRNF